MTRSVQTALVVVCLLLGAGCGVPGAAAQSPKSKSAGSPVSARAIASARHTRAHRAALDRFVKKRLGAVVETYQHLHANPELSLQESQTAALVAKHLTQSGYQVTPDVGGHGVVGVLKNGRGPVLLIRGDMDALPITEQTGLPFASKARIPVEDGGQVGVMHACGHDVHVANLLAVAEFLSSERRLWSGTIVIVAQPAEELGKGALAMIEDGLFDRFPRPDLALALHVEPEVVVGRVAVISGWAAANVDTVDIELFGRGGHGARPHKAIDPVVTAAHLVTALQTLVSRRVDPQSPAVVTVGSIHAGTKHSVIPDSARLQLTIRSYSQSVRTTLLEGVHQLTAQMCEAFGCSRPAVVRVKEAYTPAVYNDPSLVAAARDIFEGVLGQAAVSQVRPTMGGEDFGRYPRALKVPGMIFRLGALSAEAHKASRTAGAEPLPSLHSSRFAPDAEPALATGIRTMGGLALALLGRR